MTFTKVLAIAAVAVLLTAGMACADSIVVPNGSFENQTTNWTGAFDDWAVSGGAAWPGWQVYASGGGAGTASDGNNLLSVYPGGVYSISGTTPTLTTSVINVTSSAFTTTSTGSFVASADCGLALNSALLTAPAGPIFTLQVSDNGTQVATGTITSSTTPGAWMTVTTTPFSVTSGDSLVVKVVESGFYTTATWNSTNANLDNVKITSSPEPATLTLLVSGLVGLLAYAWRRRRA